MSQQVHYFVSMPFSPQNSVQPQCRTRSKLNLNIIFVLIIVTHAQGSVYVKKIWGSGVFSSALIVTYDEICCISRLKHTHYYHNAWEEQDRRLPGGTWRQEAEALLRVPRHQESQGRVHHGEGGKPSLIKSRTANYPISFNNHREGPH